MSRPNPTPRAWFPLIPVLCCLSSSGCVGARVVRFDVAPRNFCSLPQRVNIDWEGIGSSAELRAAPPVSEIPEADVGLSGSRDVTVNDSTRFVFTVTASRGSDEESESASLVTGTVDHALGGLADCDAAGNFLLEVEVPATEYTRDVVVRSISNNSTTTVNVSGPGGTVTLPPHTAGNTLLDGRPLVGLWTITGNEPGCAGSRGATAGEREPGSVSVAVVVEAGCP
jgi:hypothetical protein